MYQEELIKKVWSLHFSRLRGSDKAWITALLAVSPWTNDRWEPNIVKVVGFNEMKKEQGRFI